MQTPPREHCRDQRRSVIGDLAALGQHRRDQQVLGTRVGRALIDVQLLLSLAGARHAQSGLTDSRRPHQPRREGKVPGVHHQPAGQKLLEDFALPDPFPGRVVWLTEFKADAVDLDLLLGSVFHESPVTARGPVGHRYEIGAGAQGDLPNADCVQGVYVALASGGSITRLAPETAGTGS
jgi:hypothetical protein